MRIVSLTTSANTSLAWTSDTGTTGSLGPEPAIGSHVVGPAGERGTILAVSTTRVGESENYVRNCTIEATEELAVAIRSGLAAVTSEV